MMQKQEDVMDKDQLILEAAKRVYVRKGMDGAVMQDIADEAGMSRTALHYYFRNKKKLFDAVFDDLFDHFLPEVEEIIYSDIPFRNKVAWFVDHYLDLLKENPYLPNFVMNELNKNPLRIIERFSLKGLLSDHMRDWIQKELHSLNSRVSASQFMANLISLCIFPFIARPLVEEFFTDDRPKAFECFIDERKQIIVETLMVSIRDVPLQEFLNH
ncbi:MAG: TetR/AcrR family transcriptional regulator [Syntrophales bacterium]|jgi:AcrR family transcriptional regulator|nr:TetR/AcrR family transcriptional regulator [Syntrophales bacterium]MDY0043883.1 TetR/AcrR family transcriptional regulator [Syntrophales bacterium]